MSKSYHTDKEAVIAKRNLKRKDCGCCPVLPRIIERKPYPGDVHPLNKKTLVGILSRVPEEYIYGLSRIELRPRDAIKTPDSYDIIGAPFGYYSLDEKSIVLYSLPLEWKLKETSPDLQESLVRWFANVSETKDGILVSWPSKGHLDFWFLCNTFYHELGHHYRHQYRHKRKRAYWKEEEIVATLHGSRLKDHLFKTLRRRRNRRIQVRGRTDD